MKQFNQDFIVEESNSDKVAYHGYHRFYPWFLAHFRGEDVNLLEIGIDRTESLKLWKGYFGTVNLHGLDINDKDFDDEAVTLHKVDQSNSEELERFAKNIDIKFDIILDDGSHVPDHQMLTIEKLWKLVKPGGIYIIEDIETSYWGKSKLYGYRFDAKKTGIMRNFIELVDIINAEVTRKITKNKLIKNFAEEVEMVTFAQNCIILVKKDCQNFGDFYLRDYQFASHINQRSIKSFLQRLIRKLPRFL